MTHREFVISDLHLGHANILTFKHDGKPLRDFPDVDTMHSTIIDNWNKTVRDVDKVYVLGDVVINKKALGLLAQLKGKKCLIRGNHDIFKLSDYSLYFYDIHGVKVKPFKAVMTHVPIHSDSFRDSWPINIHGHLHGNLVRKEVAKRLGDSLRFDIPEYENDKRYINVCVEQVNYTPVDLEKIYEDKKEFMKK